MPMPRNWTDDAYFAPLRHLQLHPEKELYLGLVHFTDGVEGTRRRIKRSRRPLQILGSRLSVVWVGEILRRSQNFCVSIARWPHLSKGIDRTRVSHDRLPLGISRVVFK